MNRLFRSALATPKNAVRLKDGSLIAWASPILSVSAIRVFSAALTSGLRLSNVEGSPAGISGNNNLVRILQAAGYCLGSLPQQNIQAALGNAKLTARGCSAWLQPVPAAAQPEVYRVLPPHLSYSAHSPCCNRWSGWSTVCLDTSIRLSRSRIRKYKLATSLTRVVFTTLRPSWLASISA